MTGPHLPTNGETDLLTPEEQEAEDDAALIELERRLKDDERNLITRTRHRLAKVKGLEQRVYIDSITNIGNRRKFNESIVRAVATAERYGTPLNLLMIDIDYFKRVNDQHGHPVGDKVLHAVAQLLQGKIRTEDEICRYGGEEFAVILSNTDNSGAQLLAETLRRGIENNTKEHEDLPEVTISIGCAQFDTRELNNITALTQAADAALRAAKKAGRNCVKVYQPELKRAQPTSVEEQMAERLTRNISGVEILLAALNRGNAEEAEQKAIELGLLPKDPNERVNLLQALLAQAQKSQQDGTVSPKR